ncbi:tRNA-specific adenosine deaminase TAD2-like isoform X2 [Syzygium oleosum]|uniref:tRNA-specific adenosine deaminase TAD2-like isoform X2 n=1 Tax=Syzygium oleosum TaxID=219896 RepID=UPI0024B94783|nr:tRNA-specific adenosine deaminase TAD2-like isoform X2 [Syzygium oleosum]
METDDVASGEPFSPEVLGFVQLAMDQAKLALDSFEVPVGCVIVEEGHLIVAGRNRTNETQNATRHAEMEALDVLFEKWQRTRFSSAEVAERFSACSLYVTCEPYIMCAAALSIIGIKMAVQMINLEAMVQYCRCIQVALSYPLVMETKVFKCCGGIMASEAVSLLSDFYEQGNYNDLAEQLSLSLSLSRT